MFAGLLRRGCSFGMAILGTGGVSLALSASPEVSSSEPSEARLPSARSLAIEPWRPRVHVVADSISLDYGPYLAAALGNAVDYSRKEGPEGRCSVNVGGDNGGDSFDVLRYLEYLADRIERGEVAGPDVVVLNCGLHDVKRGLSPEDGMPLPAQVGEAVYRRNVGAILEVVQNRLRADALWVRTTPVDDGLHAKRQPAFVRHDADVVARNRIADAVCAERGVRTADLYETTAALGGAYLDHVHFTNDACRVQGKRVSREVLRLLVARFPEFRPGVTRKGLTAEQWEHFVREGFVVLPAWQVWEYGQQDLVALQRRMDEIMLGAADVPYDKMMMQLDSSTGRYEDNGEQSFGWKGATLRYRKMQNLDHDPLVMNYLRQPVMKEACARVYGADTPIASFRTMFFNKPAKPKPSSSSEESPTGGTTLPWHQDRWRFLDRDPILNVYLALDAATPESGAVQIIPRSHRRGVINKQHHSAFLTEAEISAECHGVEGDSARPEPIALTMRPGEVALIHNWVLHRSGVNSTSSPRRALSVTYMDARSKLNEAEFGQHKGGELKATGYPEGGTEFPVIFPATRR